MHIEVVENGSAFTGMPLSPNSPPGSSLELLRESLAWGVVVEVRLRGGSYGLGAVVVDVGQVIRRAAAAFEGGQRRLRREVDIHQAEGWSAPRRSIRGVQG